MSVRVLLVDDHEILVKGLGELLRKRSGIEVVGELTDAAEAVKFARDQRPDVVVMDLTMPGMNGIEATRQITSDNGGVRVIVLSVHGERPMVEAALQAGASGYVLKGCTADELVRVIRVVVSGKSYLSPGIVDTVIDVVRTKESAVNSSAFGRLTDREREVLQRLAEGQSTRGIAESLNLSVKTVGTYRERIMHKLEIRSVAELTKYAIREGLTSVDS